MGETSTMWCPNGWTPPPEWGAPPLPPPDVNCSSLPCNFNASAYEAGGIFLFDVVNDPFEHHNVAAQNPDVVADLLARLRVYNDTQIPQANSPMDAQSNPSKFGDVWTPWRGDPTPSHCSNNVTSPEDGLHSNFDGLVYPSTGPCFLQGWVWDDKLAGGGTPPLNVTVSVDGQIHGPVLANISRSGLPSKTGAPNTEHGFAIDLLDAVCMALKSGSHRFTAEAIVPPSG